MLFYNAYIKSHFEYYCGIWGNSFNSNLHKIEKLQRRACKLILGTDYISLEDARRQLNMLSFEELVFVNKAKVMFKVTQGISPIYITEMFQIKGCNNEDTMTLRSDSNKKFKTPKPKLNMFKNSLSYSGTLIWNSIPLEIRNSNTIGDFVKKMYNMDERPLVYIFVFTYLHRRISFDVLQSQNLFKHTLLKVDFFNPPFFLKFCIIFFPLIFTCTCK